MSCAYAENRGCVCLRPPLEPCALATAAVSVSEHNERAAPCSKRAARAERSSPTYASMNIRDAPAPPGARAPPSAADRSRGARVKLMMPEEARGRGGDSSRCARAVRSSALLLCQAVLGSPALLAPPSARQAINGCCCAVLTGGSGCARHRRDERDWLSHRQGAERTRSDRSGLREVCMRARACAHVCVCVHACVRARARA